MACLDDAQILDLVDGQLEGTALEAADSHLDTCPECRAVVSGLARTHASEPSHSSATDNLARGAEVGRFVVLDLIGGGGMGLVYAAYDPQLDRRVALKLMRRNRTDGGGGGAGDDRLLGEARAMARLNHPNVVQIHDVGRVGDTVYLAMALIEGESLSQWWKRRPRTWQDIRDVFVQAGRGLAAAHAAGLVHRDFKPDNVIVDVHGRVHVTDFGLAQGALEGDDVEPELGAELDDALAVTHTRTTTGALIGTPAYMAPEQLRGETANARSDQFAFCGTLYEALYGCRPLQANSLGELLELASGEHTITAPKSGAPSWLASLIETGLSHDPAARHASMDDLLEAMDVQPPPRRAWLPTGLMVGALAVLGLVLSQSTKTSSACEGADAELAKVWNDSRRQGLRAGLGATKATFAADLPTKLEGAIGRWAQRWTRAHTATCRATHVSKQQSPSALDARMSCLGRRLGELDALIDKLTAGDAATAARALDAVAALPPLDSCEDVTSLMALPPLPRDESKRAAIVALQRRLADLRATVAVGDYRTATTIAEAADREATKLGYRPLIAEAKLLRADAIRRAGMAHRADPIAYDALFAAQSARDDRNVAHAWLLLVAIAGEQGAYPEAGRRLRHARAAVTRLGPVPRLQAAVANTAGILAYNMKEYDDAARELALALKIRTRTLGDSHVAVARTHTSLGNLARARGGFDDAMRHHKRAMIIDREIRGPMHPSEGKHLHNIAGVLRKQGQLDQALATYQRALAVKKERLGALHPEVALTLNSIGLVHFARQDLDEAEVSYKAALAIYGDVDTAARADTVHNLSLVEAERRRLVSATPVPRPRPTRITRPVRAKPPASTTKPTPTPRPGARRTGPTYGAGQSWDGAD